MAVIAASGTILSITSADANTTVPLWSPTDPGVYSAVLVATITDVGTDGAISPTLQMVGGVLVVNATTAADDYVGTLYQYDYSNGVKWGLEIEPWVEPTGSEFELVLNVGSLYDGDVSVEWWVVQVSALA